MKTLSEPGISTDQAQNWYTSSTDSNEKMCQSSPWSVPISQSYDQNKFQLFLLIKTIEKINQSPENCCEFMRALALSQAGVFVEEL